MKIGSQISSFFGYITAVIFGFIKKLFYLLEFFLLLRLSLKFFEANPQSLVVDWIYNWSDFLVKPFNLIFEDIILSNGYVLEAATIAAMAGYAILVFIILKLARIL